MRVRSAILGSLPRGDRLVLHRRLRLARSGLIDLREQAEGCSELRTDTPTLIRVKAFSAPVLWTDASKARSPGCSGPPHVRPTEVVTGYRYTFAHSVQLNEVEDLLALAVVATESLLGETQCFLDAFHTFDESARQLLIDASTDVGRCLNQIFSGFLRREFGSDGFTVDRLEKSISGRALVG
jgi:hypothetical protein